MIQDIRAAGQSSAKALVNVTIVVAALAASACEHQASNQADTERAAAQGVAAGSATPVKLLSATFEPRAIRKIEVGDFHLTGGQAAPVHTHAAPALGYVSKGSIVYQVEGKPVQILKAGDAFYEPVGPQILHFDNASATEEAVFTDFNFERTGEPFIVFAKPPVNLKIDRRTFPTVEIQTGPNVGTIDIYELRIVPGGSIQRAAKPLPIMGYVADGSIELRGADAPRSIAAGQSFNVPAGQSDVTLANASQSEQARIVTFEPVL